jgi:formate-dependent nitrite reductase membrane component NrfD
LNQKDCFDLKILVTNFQKLSIDGRIAGVKAIQERDSTTLEAYSKVVLAFTAIVITAFSGFLINSLPAADSSIFSRSGELIAIVLVSTLATFLGVGAEALTTLKKKK